MTFMTDLSCLLMSAHFKLADYLQHVLHYLLGLLGRKVQTSFVQYVSP